MSVKVPPISTAMRFMRMNLLSSPGLALSLSVGDRFFIKTAPFASLFCGIFAHPFNPALRRERIFEAKRAVHPCSWAHAKKMPLNSLATFFGPRYTLYHSDRRETCVLDGVLRGSLIFGRWLPHPREIWFGTMQHMPGARKA